MAPPQQEQAAPAQPQWMLLDKKANVALKAAEVMVSESQKLYKIGPELKEGGPETEEEQQALAEALNMMIKAQEMYRKAEGYLIDCNVDTEVALKEMKEQRKQGKKSAQDTKCLTDMYSFKDHQIEKLQGVQEQVQRIGSHLNMAVEKLGLELEQTVDPDAEEN